MLSEGQLGTFRHEVSRSGHYPLSKHWPASCGPAREVAAGEADVMPARNGSAPK
jgi:hypothetical protein